MSFDPNIFAGDLMCSELDGKFHVSKVLKVDLDNQTYHVLSYFPAAEKPTIDTLDGLDIYALHAPLATFESAEKIGDSEVTQDDLQGFYYYLKTTDFARYCQETEQNIDHTIERANTCFREGYAFTDEKKHDEAIAKYLEAVELYPLFYEAIDNMAFLKMNMSRWSDAIDDFRWSLEIESKNVLAEFSIGECYMKMGHLPEAKDQFERALEMESDNPLALDFLAKVEAMMAAPDEANQEEIEQDEPPAAEEAPLIEAVTEPEAVVEESDEVEEKAPETLPEESDDEATPDSRDAYLNTPLTEQPDAPQPSENKKWWRFGK
jgi:tetratricopeptide (TPR) repeat protein